MTTDPTSAFRADPPQIGGERALLQGFLDFHRGTLLWVHGGGFVTGTALQDDRFCAATARDLGIVVVSVRYRLAPDHYADRLQSSGSCAITDRTNGGSVRTVTGSLKVRALIVGGAVERAIVSGLKEHLAAEVALVDRYIADHTQ